MQATENYLLADREVQRAKHEEIEKSEPTKNEKEG